MNYSHIRQFDIANGEGIRTSLFVSGCQFHCKGCFNSEAQSYINGVKYTEETHKQIFNYLSNPNISGLSILGGDPLWQSASDMISLIDLCQDAHSLNKTVWLWSGFTWESIFSKIDTDYLDLIKIYRQELISNVDIFVDGQFIESKKDLRLKWCGSSNQRVIDVKKSFKLGKIILYQGES